MRAFNVAVPEAGAPMCFWFDYRGRVERGCAVGVQMAGEVE
jgi:hypothetical protein